MWALVWMRRMGCDQTHLQHQGKQRQHKRQAQQYLQTMGSLCYSGFAALAVVRSTKLWMVLHVGTKVVCVGLSAFLCI